MRKKKSRVTSGYAGRKRSVRPDDQFEGSVHEGSERPHLQSHVSSKRRPLPTTANGLKVTSAKIGGVPKPKQTPIATVKRTTPAKTPIHDEGHCRVEKVKNVSKSKDNATNALDKEVRVATFGADSSAPKWDLKTSDNVYIKKAVLKKLNQDKHKYIGGAPVTGCNGGHIRTLKLTRCEPNSQLKTAAQNAEVQTLRRAEPTVTNRTQTNEEIGLHIPDETASSTTDVGMKPSTLARAREMRRFDEIGTSLNKFQIELTEAGGNFQTQNYPSENTNNTTESETKNKQTFPTVKRCQRRPLESKGYSAVRKNSMDQVTKDSDAPKQDTSGSTNNQVNNNLPYVDHDPSWYEQKNRVNENARTQPFATKSDLVQFETKMTENIVTKLQTMMSDTVTGAMSKLDLCKHVETLYCKDKTESDADKQKTKEYKSIKSKDQAVRDAGEEDTYENTEEPIRKTDMQSMREMTPSFFNIHTDGSRSTFSQSVPVTNSTAFSVVESTTYSEEDLWAITKDKQTHWHQSTAGSKCRVKRGLFFCCTGDTVVANAHAKIQDHRSEIVQEQRVIPAVLPPVESIGENIIKEEREANTEKCNQSTAFFIPSGDYWVKQAPVNSVSLNTIHVELTANANINKVGRVQQVEDKRELIAPLDHSLKQTQEAIESPPNQNQEAVSGKRNSSQCLRQTNVNKDKISANNVNKGQLNKHNVPPVHVRQEKARKYGTVQYHQQVLKANATMATNVKYATTKIDTWNEAALNVGVNKRAHPGNDSLPGAQTRNVELNKHAMAYKIRLQKVKPKIDTWQSRSTINVLDTNLACIQDSSAMFKVAAKPGARAKASTSAKAQPPSGYTDDFYIPSWINKGTKNPR